MPQDIEITLNGAEKVLTGLGGTPTISDLVASLGFRADRVALERNGDIVPRDTWPGVAVLAGDRIELVHFVGGGSA